MAEVSHMLHVERPPSLGLPEHGRTRRVDHQPRWHTRDAKPRGTAPLENARNPELMCPTGGDLDASRPSAHSSDRRQKTSRTQEPSATAPLKQKQPVVVRIEQRAFSPDPLNHLRFAFMARPGRGISYACTPWEVVELPRKRTPSATLCLDDGFS